MTHDQHPDRDDPMLDVAYDVPECVFELVKKDPAPGALRNRLWVSPGHDFLELDKRRWFVRGLFPVPIEGELEFRFGVWLELLSRAEFAHLMRVWNDPVAYPKLNFEARLANDLERPGSLGEHVHVIGSVDMNEKPHVYSADRRELDDLLRVGWSKAGYERFLDEFERKLDASC
jgi:hypothetical protein